jgi:pimeloyl-ACP methyl ester carboxylesterase
MANPGILHTYSDRLFAFEHSPISEIQTEYQKEYPTLVNTILWVGGLGDGVRTVRYPKVIATYLPRKWALAEVLLSSSYKGWATGSLKRDALELGWCVQYFKHIRRGGKIVLMGHSTGCQDIMEYLVGEGKELRHSVHGAILQAGVSDREAAMAASDAELQQTLKQLVAASKTLIEEGKETQIVPGEGNEIEHLFGAPVTAYRLYSLLAPGGDDDYFSSDLSDDTLANTFGNIRNTPMMFLWGSEDQYVPAHVDKEGLLKRWTDAVKNRRGVVDVTHGGVIKHAHHNLDEDLDEVVQDLVTRVLGFLEGIEKHTRPSDKGGRWEGTGVH